MKRWSIELVYSIFVILLIYSLCYFYILNTKHIYQPLEFNFLFNESELFLDNNWFGFTPKSSMWVLFLVGLFNTVGLSFVTMIFATIIGTLVGLMPFMNMTKCNSSFISVFRNVPLFVQLLAWYFGVFYMLPNTSESIHFLGLIINIKGLYFPSIGILSSFIAIFFCILSTQPINKNLKFLSFILLIIYFYIYSQISLPIYSGNHIVGGVYISSECLSLCISISLFTSAYIAEIISNAIKVVDIGQFDAANGLGLSFFQCYRYVIIPQIFQMVRPLLNNQYINIIKNSSLGALIGFPELMGLTAGSILSNTSRNVEVMFLALATYFLLCHLMTLMFGEKR